MFSGHTEPVMHFHGEEEPVLTSRDGTGAAAENRKEETGRHALPFIAVKSGNERNQSPDTILSLFICSASSQRNT